MRCVPLTILSDGELTQIEQRVRRSERQGALRVNLEAPFFDLRKLGLLFPAVQRDVGLVDHKSDGAKLADLHGHAIAALHTPAAI